MTTRIKLSKNLHEKMEFAISQYIQTLRESENDTNNILNIYKNSEIDDIIVGLFKHSAYKCDESTLFNKIANDYFVKTEYNELQQYNDAYFNYYNQDNYDPVNGPEWKYNDTIYLKESKYIVLIDPAYVFAKLNVNFIKEQLLIIDTTTLLK